MVPDGVTRSAVIRPRSRSSSHARRSRAMAAGRSRTAVGHARLGRCWTAAQTTSSVAGDGGTISPIESGMVRSSSPDSSDRAPAMPCGGDVRSSVSSAASWLLARSRATPTSFQATAVSAIHWSNTARCQVERSTVMSCWRSHSRSARRTASSGAEGWRTVPSSSAAVRNCSSPRRVLRCDSRAAMQSSQSCWAAMPCSVSRSCRGARPTGSAASTPSVAWVVDVGERGVGEVGAAW